MPVDKRSVFGNTLCSAHSMHTPLADTVRRGLTEVAAPLPSAGLVSSAAGIYRWRRHRDGRGLDLRRVDEEN